MSVYSVYARAPGGSEWSLRRLCASADEADWCARAAVRLEPEAGQAATEAVVVEWEQRTDVPERLPEAWATPVVARYGRPRPSPAGHAPSGPPAPSDAAGPESER
jgi:hypothetical protein